MPDTLPHSIVYSCTFANYDYTFGPLARTPNTDFLRFGTTSPNRHRIWQHKAVPAALEQNTQTLTNRYFKLFPAKTLPECDIAIYVDGNILVRESLAPIIREFWDSGADVALFRHPSGRTLGEEIDFALANRIPIQDAVATENQRAKYTDLDLMDRSITENTILFYRMSSPKVAEIGQMWWEELDRYCKRDQISLPFVLHKVAPKVHIWDWHFHHPAPNNPYFARYSHRRPGILNRAKQVSYFMKDYSWEYSALYKTLKLGGALRKMIGFS